MRRLEAGRSWILVGTRAKIETKIETKIAGKGVMVGEVNELLGILN